MLLSDDDDDNEERVESLELKILLLVDMLIRGFTKKNVEFVRLENKMSLLMI